VISSQGLKAFRSPKCSCDQHHAPLSSPRTTLIPSCNSKTILVLTEQNALSKSIARMAGTTKSHAGRKLDG
jgi:hypothetical protein